MRVDLLTGEPPAALRKNVSKRFTRIAENTVTRDDGAAHAEELLDRFVLLDGCFNFRDLGGYPALSGRTVRRGCVYRSDALHRLTARGTQAFSALGVATVIDLRAPAEVSGKAWQPPPGWPGDHLHIPLRPAVPDWAAYSKAQLESPGFAAMHYLETFRDSQAAIQAAVQVLADPARLPAVFHCAAGKDRTGIIAALVLTLLGVPAPYVADDYALSEIATQRWDASIAAGGHDDTQTAWAYVPPAMLTADRLTMTTFLDRIQQAHPTADNLAAAIGITGPSLQHLRGSLLTQPEPAPKLPHHQG
jgi:protein-tyrosine phosphatase